MLIGVTIALAGLLFVATSGLLYWRWATMREPRCILLVESPPALRGGEVIVDGVAIPPEQPPHRVTIGAGERFAIPFYLDFGTYEVSVTMGDEVLFKSEVSLTQEKPHWRLDLSKVSPPLQPGRPATTQAGTEPPPPELPSALPPTLTPPPGADTLRP